MGNVWVCWVLFSTKPDSRTETNKQKIIWMTISISAFQTFLLWLKSKNCLTTKKTQKNPKFECQTTETFQFLSTDRQIRHLLLTISNMPLQKSPYFSSHSINCCSNVQKCQKVQAGEKLRCACLASYSVSSSCPLHNSKWNSNQGGGGCCSFPWRWSSLTRGMIIAFIFMSHVIRLSFKAVEHLYRWIRVLEACQSVHKGFFPKTGSCWAAQQQKLQAVAN